jgi:hypothetical protein
LPTYTNTAKYLLRKLTGSNLISDVDAGIAALADDIDSKFAGYSSGPLASRPVSTGGTPGITGRRYRATDTGQEFIDTGTSWMEIAEAGISARASAFGGLSIANNTWATVSFTTEDWDNAAMFAPTRTYIEAMRAGVYSVKAWAQWNTNATGLRAISVVRTNAAGTDQEIAPEDYRTALSGIETRNNISMDFKCNLGDRIVMRAFQTSGGALNTSPYMAVALLSR